MEFAEISFSHGEKVLIKFFISAPVFSFHMRMMNDENFVRNYFLQRSNSLLCRICAKSPYYRWEELEVEKVCHTNGCKNQKDFQNFQQQDFLLFLLLFSEEFMLEQFEFSPLEEFIAQVKVTESWAQKENRGWAHECEKGICKLRLQASTWL